MSVPKGDRSSKAPRPKFSLEQRRRLKDLKLTVGQIDEIESFALPIGRAWLRKPPALLDVREELQALSSAMGSARDAMSRLLDDGSGTPAQREAVDRVAVAIYGMGADDELIEKALGVVTLIYRAAESAKHEMPREQRRHKTASIFPVRRIDEALLSGFVKEHASSERPLPPYNTMITRGRFARSAFSEVVNICYVAMGQEKPDAERAIKAYLAWRRRLDNAPLGPEWDGRG